MIIVLMIVIKRVSIVTWITLSCSGENTVSTTILKSPRNIIISGYLQRSDMVCIVEVRWRCKMRGEACDHEGYTLDRSEKRRSLITRQSLSRKDRSGSRRDLSPGGWGDHGVTQQKDRSGSAADLCPGSHGNNGVTHQKRQVREHGRYVSW